MNHPKKERTFVIIKSDGLQRSLVGDIINRLEKTGLKFIGMKMLIPTKEQTLAHYNKDEAWMARVGGRIIESIKNQGGKPKKEPIEYGYDVLDGLVNYMTSCPVIAIALEGNQAVGIVKKIVGGTEPLTSDVGTIRGDYTIDSYEIANLDGRAVRNLAHCSDAVDEAHREIKIWFSDDEIHKYRLISEEMLYDVNLDGILE